MKRTVLLVSTRKGAFFLRSSPGPASWKLEGPHAFGHIVHHTVLDPRDKRTLLIAAKTGHLGPTVFRSMDYGKNWKEAAKPPAFHKAPEGEKGLVVQHVFWLTPGHASEPNVWYAGTSPQGLFRSEDGGVNWESVDGFNRHPQRNAWAAADQEGPPDGATMHSINIDPRDPNHMMFGMSSGGVFETTDKGQTWAPLNRGCVADFLPDPNAEYGHDPHCVRMHPMEPDRVYQQNHCGIYRLDGKGSERRWERIGNNMPKKVGDIGFSCVLHPRDPATVWVFPMDGTQVWPRTSIGGKPAVYVTRDSGKSWKRLDKGLPEEQGWFTVYRQAMTADNNDPVGLYFGTTNGEVWASRKEGERWKCITRHLPKIQAVETAIFPR